MQYYLLWELCSRSEKNMDGRKFKKIISNMRTKDVVSNDFATLDIQYRAYEKEANSSKNDSEKKKKTYEVFGQLSLN